MSSAFCIGLDFGTASARGVLIDAESGRQVRSAIHPYRHGTLSTVLPGGRRIPRHFALQVPSDYVEAMEGILSELGAGREVLSIGVDFTASSPLPTTGDGTPLCQRHPDHPHAYVKLWKHASAQAFADTISAGGGAYLDNFGGKLSGESMLPKAMEIASEAPDLWQECERFIEAGDWIVWQLTGNETRSLDFACYKAQFRAGRGYPADVVPGLVDRLRQPAPVGTVAGHLTAALRARTGIAGNPVVSVASIDSHAVLPAVGAVRGGEFVGALGTSSGFLATSREDRPLPQGLTGAGFGAALPDLWCCEAGQAAFGDALNWFVGAFPLDANPDANFAKYNAAAQTLSPGESGLLALDWLGGNRVPSRDSALSGVLVGLRLDSTAVGIYRALLESLCYGSRLIVDLAEAGGLSIGEIVLTSGLADSNPFLIQTMANVMGRPVVVPQIKRPTAVGAAIHSAVAAGVLGDYADGYERFGKGPRKVYEPAAELQAVYGSLYNDYRRLAEDGALADTMRSLSRLSRQGL